MTVEILAADQAEVDRVLTTIRTDERVGDLSIDYYGDRVKETGRW